MTRPDDALRALSGVVSESIGRVRHALAAPSGEFAGQAQLVIYECETASSALARYARSVRRHGLTEDVADRRGPPRDPELLATALAWMPLFCAVGAERLAICAACDGYRVAARPDHETPRPGAGA